MTISLPELEIVVNELIQEFVNTLFEYEFFEARRHYYKLVKKKVEDAYLLFLQCDKPVNWTLPSLHVILFESASFFQTMLKNRDNEKIKTLLLHCSSCLNANNEPMYKSFLSEYDIGLIQIKHHLLEEYIHKTLKADSVCAKSLLYLHTLCVFYGNEFLLKLVEKSVKNHGCLKLCPLDMQNQLNQENVPNIEYDANICRSGEDPPGQKSSYIPPGDTNQEKYRLSTFLKFPRASPVDCRKLARIGFYFTGYKDRVKCFCCGIAVESWTVGDDVTHARWHEPNCKMSKGEDCGNVSLVGEFSRFSPPQRSSPVSSEMNKEVTQSQPASAQANVTNTSNTRNVPAGLVLMQPIETTETSSSDPGYLNFELATISSSYHSNLIRSLNLRSEADRLKTYVSWPRDQRIVEPRDLARSGFFYLGSLDRVQCFSCGGVLRSWNRGDNVEHEHAEHFPSCRMVRNIEAHNVPIISAGNSTLRNSQAPEPPELSTSERENLRNMFPCLYPANPHMSGEDSRIETFDQRWPTTRVRASPEEIGRAGFFYLGDRDRVKCWYCSGGLQNWEFDDDPWIEHAKWFPTCDFLLQKKGADFVHRIVARYPNIRRPLLRSGYDVPPPVWYRENDEENISPSAPPPPIIDPKAEKARIDVELREAMSSNLVKEAEMIGFTLRLIQRCIRSKLERGEKSYETLTAMVEDLTNADSSSGSDDDEDNEDNKDDDTQPKAAATTSNKDEENQPTSSSLHLPEESSMESRIRELEVERQCKVCLDQPAEVVFVPCGHLCCCVRCTTGLRKCPICRSKIEKAIRTYVS